MHESMVPYDVRKLLMDSIPFEFGEKIEDYKIQNQDFIVNGEYIIVDGVKYKRPQ